MSRTVPSRSSNGGTSTQPNPGHFEKTLGKDNMLPFNLSCSKFRALWLLMLTLHTVGAVFYVMVALAYQYLLSTALVWSITLYSLSINVKLYPMVTGIHALLGAGHCFGALKMVWRSISQHRLTFQALPATTLSLAQPGPPANLVRPIRCRWFPTRQRKVRDALSRIIGVVDSDCEFIEFRTNLRVVVDTALLSYQCYRMSWFLSWMRLLRLYTAMLVMNCWTNPLILFLINRTNSNRRLIEARVVIDVVLDVMTVLVIPCVLLYTYAEQFDVVRRDFPRDFYYDDQSLMRFLNEFKVLLVYSGVDLLQRLALGCDLLFCLESLKKIAYPALPVSSIRPTTTSQHALTTLKIDDIKKTGSIQTLSTFPAIKIARNVNSVCRVGFIVWGLVVACAHLYAETKQTSTDCVLVVRPWFRAKPGCALIEISGANFSAAQDTQNAVAERLATFDEAAVSYLILSHHAALHVPPSIQSLRNLVGLKMKNVTLIEWNYDAALTQTHHPRVRFVFLVQLTVSELPRGLLSSDFPSLLLDIEVCGSTLAEMPSNLPAVWPRGAWLFLDYSNFTAVPEVLLDMDAVFLQLAFNHIPAVPPEMFTNPALSWIGLSGNPISSLPETLRDDKTQLQLLSLDHTNISRLPTWMSSELLSMEVYLGHTPYCNALGEANQTAYTINYQPLCRVQDDCRRLHQIM